MNATRDSTVAARIPHDLRTDLERLALNNEVELSVVVRLALREHADRELGRVNGREQTR